MMEHAVRDCMDTLTPAMEMIRTISTPLLATSSYWLTPLSLGACVSNEPPLKALLRQNTWVWPKLVIKLRGIGCSWRKLATISEIRSPCMVITKALLTLHSILSLGDVQSTFQSNITLFTATSRMSRSSSSARPLQRCWLTVSLSRTHTRSSRTSYQDLVLSDPDCLDHGGMLKRVICAYVVSLGSHTAQPGSRTMLAGRMDTTINYLLYDAPYLHHVEYDHRQFY